MTSCSVSLAVEAIGGDLHLEIKLNGQIKFSRELTTNAEKISFDFDDSKEADHVLEVIMSGKKSDHTVLNDAGSIIQDRLIKITDFSLDGISLGQLFFDKVTYLHDFNGTAAPIEDKFFGAMGCNGSLRLEFSSPLYMWLLENM